MRKHVFAVVCYLSELAPPAQAKAPGARKRLSHWHQFAKHHADVFTVFASGEAPDSTLRRCGRCGSRLHLSEPVSGYAAPVERSTVAPRGGHGRWGGVEEIQCDAALLPTSLRIEWRDLIRYKAQRPARGMVHV